MKSLIVCLCAVLALLCAAPVFAGGIVVRQRVISPRVVRQRIVVAPQAIVAQPLFVRQRAIFAPQQLIVPNVGVQQLIVPQQFVVPQYGGSQSLIIVR